MQVDFGYFDNTLTVSMNGELDEYSAKNARSEIDDRITFSNMNIVIFDLSGLTFMDSTGIGVLIGRYKLLKSRGIAVFIKSPTRNVDKVLSLTGIYEIMPKIN